MGAGYATCLVFLGKQKAHFVSPGKQNIANTPESFALSEGK